MKTAILLILPLVALLLIAAPLVPVFRGALTGKKAKRNIIANLCAFAGLCLIAVIVPMGGLVSAADAAAAASTASGMGYIAAALVTGLACIGAGIAVAAGAPAAIGAVSEDPKVFAKALIFVVLGEGIAIYGLLISILILNNL
ncbi:MAG TPA: ATPase [Candidatus Merdivicinus intestinavium]|nr:ATPase [Candidatus Merdivicinus intestinavium]